MHAVQVLILAALGLVSTVQAFCKPAVGVRVMTDNMCKVVYCGIGGSCSYMPCHQITIFHPDGSQTKTGMLVGSAPFKKGIQAKVAEWDYFGSRDHKGFAVQSRRCPRPDDHLYCFTPGQVKRTNKGFLGVSYVYYDCGQVPPIPK
ncbi:MAG: hypothetical protein J3R72DRAFT_446446 [Linnemannia gamsii]|nr:MAG: hypothetical protein J3R72DRAFT_446446 [Linnemannia gamsii]